MSTDPGVDELLARYNLRHHGVSPTPPDLEDDWWNELYADDDPNPAPDDPDDDPDGAGWFRKLSGLPPVRRKRDAPGLGGDDPDDEAGAPDEPGWEDAPRPDESTPAAVRRSRQRQEINAVWAGLERRTRWLLSTSAGAGCGWFLDLEQAMSGWIADCARDQGQTAGLILGAGLVAAGSYLVYRARGWWPPLAWCCRIPLATALLALALYAPGGTS